MEGFLSIYMIGCGGDSDDGEGEVQDAAFVSAAPGSSDLAANASITVTFDNDPGAVTASAGDVSGAEKSRTISSPFTLGTLALVHSWENGGSHTLFVYLRTINA